jgi:hypothetical protein
MIVSLICTGVLQRHESLAANLGAKLVGPLLLKSFEKLFDGPIKIIQSSFAIEQSPVSWLDIVTFARSNPNEFGLSDSTHGIKACRFWIKGGQVEISEDDYRLIMSGAPERMIPTQPIAEDESAELGTLNILEARLAMLIKKADAVASKARQLNYHLKGRKTAVMARKAVDQPASVANEEPRTFSPQPFSAINSRSPASVNGEAAKLQQNLLEQFLSSSRRPSLAPQSRPKASRLPTAEAPVFHHTFNNAHQDADARRMSHPITSSDDGAEGQYRVLMAAKIEKLARGDPIYPSCDRCRRLKFECTKHLTACSACTKKHAKCSWKDVKEGELEGMAPFVGAPGQVQGSENGYPGSGTGMLENLDSGLRAAVEQQGEARVSMQGVGMERDMPERRPELAAEHLVLTQIASAAAAAGTR